MIGGAIAEAARLLTGARARWNGCAPEPGLRVYFANHTSNLDFVLLWAALPRALRKKTRPVAAQDYWRVGGIRQALAEQVFNAVLIERKRVTRDNNPIQPMLAALQAGDSLIIFPEGGRMSGGEVGEFRAGLYHIARQMPAADLVPVYIENLNRVMPKGEVLPIPILCSVTFGTPLRLAAGEGKATFLDRARGGLLGLMPR
jgi:1-acyl-sn-glycerol-3-phosphate acyltransferase